MQFSPTIAGFSRAEKYNDKYCRKEVTNKNNRDQIATPISLNALDDQSNIMY